MTVVIRCNVVPGEKERSRLQAYGTAGARRSGPWAVPTRHGYRMPDIPVQRLKPSQTVQEGVDAEGGFRKPHALCSGVYSQQKGGDQTEAACGVHPLGQTA